MKKGYPKIEYDKESEVLSFRLKRGKSVDSDTQGNVVIDYNDKGDVVGVQFYDFDFSSFRESKKELQEFAKRGSTLVSVS